MQKIVGIVVAVVVALAGCATPPPLSTPSGNPEVRIHDVSKKQVLDTIVSATTAKGMQVKSINDYSVVVTKLADGDFMSALLFGSRYDSTPEARLTFTTIVDPGNIHVFARAEMVTNPGSAFERRHDVTNGYRQRLQTMLEQLDQRLTANVVQRPEAAHVAPTISAPANVTVIPSADSPHSQSPQRTTGQDTYQAEALARQKSCAAQPLATLAAKGPGFETYNVPCANGDTWAVRCEFGNCRVLR